MMRKGISMLLVGLMLLALLPVQVLATDVGLENAGLDTSNLVFDVTAPAGYVTISFADTPVRPEDAAILDVELYGAPVGTIIGETQVPCLPGDSVADVTVRLLEAMGLAYSHTGTAEDGFYLSALEDFELNGIYYPTFGEFDAGYQSGWCVRRNNWHINAGSSAVEVEDGDVITWLYTCQYGADIGADFSTKSAEITDVVLADSSLQLAYNEEADRYICNVPADIASLAFEVMLENYASVVTVMVDGFEVRYRPNQAIRVTNNSTITISTELEYMDAANNNEITVYTDSMTIQLQAESKPTEPEVTEPEVTEPESTEPEITEPEVTEPEVTEPESTKPASIDLIYRSTGDYLASLAEAEVGSINGEWRIIGLARSGREVAEDYYTAAVGYVLDNINQNQQLHSHKATENARIILALTAIGKDVSDVAGHDLLKGLTSMDYVKYQGINGPIWTLLAFDSHGYAIPEGDASREKLVQEILNAQLSDGGWALSGTASDPDMTGMALQALAPYREKDGVKAAVEKALNWLSEVQRADGAFAGADGISSESLAQVITALTTLGIDPEEDERFIKNGISPVDALAEFYVEGGGFRHVLRGSRDGMATEQSYYALVSYFRLREGKTSLYDMTDVKLDDQAAKEVESLIDAIGTPITLDSKAALETARKAYDALTSVQKGLVGNYGTLTGAEKTYAELSKTTEDEAAADAVEALITAIGTPVKPDSEKAIQAAREAYDKLTITQKALVENLKGLTDAEDTLHALKEEAEADKVEALINAIGNNITLNSETAIQKARSAYDGLTADQRKLVKNYQALLTAEIKLKELKSTVSVSFTLLGCYSHGTDQIHTLADGNLSAWISATTYKVAPGATVKDVLEKALAAYGMSWSNPTGNYVESINGIGEFTNGTYSGWMYTLNGTHPNLGVAQQTVENGDEIVFHYTDDYTREASGRGYGAKDEEAANAVEKLIDAIGDKITPDSEGKIKAARDAYEKLTEKQKALVENYDTLVKAEKRLAEQKPAVSEDIFKTTGDYMEALGTPGVGSVGGEWMVLGLVRSGRQVSGDYYDRAVEYVKENIDENGRLHRVKSTENSRMILALTALGKDVTDVGGHDLLAALTDMDYVCKQGINGPIWALIAFDSGSYPIPEGDVTREILIDTILAAQLSDGGWALSGSVSDPDMTGMAVQALAPYCASNAEVKTAVDGAIQTMSEMQNDDGGYSSIDGASSESSAQVIVALSALGIDADADPRFVKNGISAYDALMAYYVEGGGFRHILSGSLDGMATEQAYYAMTAYDRFLNGKTSLYDMTDVIDMGGDGEKAAPETAAATEPDMAAETKDSAGSGWFPLVLSFALGVAAAVVVMNHKKIFGKR